MFGPQRHKNLAGALPVPPGGAVVDLGCGRGLTLGELAARVDGASKLVGVDLTAEGAPDEWVQHVAADLNERLPFADDEFDAAVCHNVIEYLHDPHAFIAEASRILAPGGPAHQAAMLVAKDGRRDPELADAVDGWLADLERQALAGEFLYSITDYAVLLRKPVVP